MPQEKKSDFEDWLAEGIKDFRAGCKKPSPRLPEEFRQHTQAARRGMSFATRSLLDAAVAWTEEKPKTKATKIKAE